MSLDPGARVGPYEVLGPLGAGGMGEVYRARDIKLGRDVAIKVLPDAFAGDPDRLARFEREARALAALNHPHIAQIYGVEDRDGARAIVMEFVPGRTLHEIIAAAARQTEGARGLPPADALRLGRQMAEALEAAHDAGIIHRDLKPANVKVTDDGTVKVLDFGLAKTLGPSEASGVASVSGSWSAHPADSPTISSASTTATSIGVIRGTAAYMSPEQARGRPIDKRADIWAFGAVLFEMLTARRAFAGADLSETIASVLRDDPALDALPPDVPASVRALLARCLDRDVKTRLRDIGEARVILERALKGDADGATATPRATARPGRRPRLPWAVAGVMFVFAALAVWRAWRPAPAIAGPVVRARQTLNALAGFVAVSRDGTRIAYTIAGGPSVLALYTRDLDQFDGRPIPGGEGGSWPILSPDGQWVAFSTASPPAKIKKVPVAGGSPVTLCDGSLTSGGAWGDDDTIVFSGARGLERVSARGGGVESLTTLDAGRGETAHVQPQWLPGGRRLLFTIVKANSYEQAEFAILDPATRTSRVVARGGVNGRYVPSGHLTYVRGTTLFALPFDIDRATPAGSEVPVVDGISLVGPSGTGDYAFSDNGVLVYSERLQAPGSTFAWADRSGTRDVLKGSEHRLWGTGRLSPDGRLVADTIQNDRAAHDLWIFDVERGTVTRLPATGDCDHPIWSPDGRMLVYTATADGQSALYTLPADGSGGPRRLLATPAAAVPTSITPDGRVLLFTQPGTDGRSRIFVLSMDADGSVRPPRPLHESIGSESQAEVSPDGRWVAYLSDDSGTRELYVQPFPGPGGRMRVSIDGAVSPRWSRSGRELFFWGASSPADRLMAAAWESGPQARLGAPHPLFQMSSGSTLDVAPGDRRFLVETDEVGAPTTTFASVVNWFADLRRLAPAK